MLQAFIDDSVSHGTLVLAGYISKVDRWEKFADEWQELLDGKGGRKPLKRFKMKEAEARRDHERCGWFYEVIERHAIASVTCTFDASGLIKAIDTFPWPAHINNVNQLRNPYYLAIHHILVGLAQHQEDLGLTE